MSGEQVLRLLRDLEAIGLVAWVDGGWGVDALVGEQTREHSDLDVVIAEDALAPVRSMLEEAGFEVLRDVLPTALALRHPDGREVDLHLVHPTADGGGDQVQPDGRCWHYDPPVTGVIAGHAVLCCPLATQLRAHIGYEPDATDIADMRLLEQRFGCELPPPYGTP